MARIATIECCGMIKDILSKPVGARRWILEIKEASGPHAQKEADKPRLPLNHRGQSRSNALLNLAACIDVSCHRRVVLRLTSTLAFLPELDLQAFGTQPFEPNLKTV